ncbi:MAG: ABC transporter permease [Nocardioides sp.]
MSSATTELTRLHARELLRDRRYFWFALIFPFFMLSIFLTLNAVMADQPGAPDFSTTVIPMAVFLAVTGAALTVTAGPVAAMRARGTLRLLGTTPIGRSRVVLTHLATRVAMVVVQLVVLLAIGTLLHTITPGDLPRVLAVSMLGLTMFLGFGYLIGGRLSSPDAATNVGTLVQLSTLFLSGLAVPLWLLPDGVARVLGWLPTTFFADLLLSSMRGQSPAHPTLVSVAVVAATAGLALFLAVRTFRWDQGEEGVQ